MRKNKRTQRLASVLAALFLAMTAFPTNVLAEGDDWEVTAISNSPSDSESTLVDTPVNADVNGVMAQATDGGYAEAEVFNDVNAPKGMGVEAVADGTGYDEVNETTVPSEAYLHVEGDVTSKSTAVAVYAGSGGHAEVEIDGTVTATGEEAFGVNAIAIGPTYVEEPEEDVAPLTTKVETGDVSAERGFTLSSIGGGTLDATLGNVTSVTESTVVAPGTEIRPLTSSPRAIINGTNSLMAANQGVVNLEAGTITSSTVGLDASAYSQGVVNYETKDISAGEIGISAVSANARIAGAVNGDVTSQNGMAVTMTTATMGIQTLTIDGDVSTQGNAPAVDIVSENGLGSLLAVTGDITSPTVGLRYAGRSVITSTVLALETISGNEAGISVNGSDTDLNLAVWRITTGQNGTLIDGDQDGTFAQKVNYIVKLEQPTAGATITATRADGKALNTLDISEDESYAVARQGDRVLLKIDVNGDYDLIGAYNGKGEKVLLLKDAQGNYYIDVEKGGGI